MFSKPLRLLVCLAIFVLGFAAAAVASPASVAAPSESDALSLPTCAADFDFTAVGEEETLCRV